MTDHIPIVPRLVDENLIQQDPDFNADQESVQNENTEISVITKHPLFNKLKMYLMPAIFVICVAIVIYILYRYFFVYRNKPGLPCLTDKQDKVKLEVKEDASKYIIDTTDEEDNDSDDDEEETDDEGDDGDNEDDDEIDDEDGMTDGEDDEDIYKLTESTSSPEDEADMNRFSMYLDSPEFSDLPPLLESDETRFEEVDELSDNTEANNSLGAEIKSVVETPTKTKRMRKSKRVSV